MPDKAFLDGECGWGWRENSAQDQSVGGSRVAQVNADIAKGIVEACAKFCRVPGRVEIGWCVCSDQYFRGPDAVLGLVVNPVNSIVHRPQLQHILRRDGNSAGLSRPAMAELYKKKGLRLSTLWCRVQISAFSTEAWTP